MAVPGMEEDTDDANIDGTLNGGALQGQVAAPEVHNQFVGGGTGDLLRRGEASDLARFGACHTLSPMQIHTYSISLIQFLSLELSHAFLVSRVHQFPAHRS